MFNAVSTLGVIKYKQKVYNERWVSAGSMFMGLFFGFKNIYEG